jgi:DNA recombination protein RmuC
MAYSLSDILVGLVIILIAILIYLLLRLSRKIEKVSISQDVIKGAFLISWKELKIDQDIGELKQKAEDIKNAAQSLQDIFKVARGRGTYGEFQLEQILKDLLPAHYVHIRERLHQTGKIPDASIHTPQGILCIDSKFPLENYQKMIKATDQSEKEKYRVAFRNDVQKQIEKIKTDYVRPEEGTTPFAFGFIPSEAIYQYLTECEMELVVNAAREGVLLVSPATLAINLNLLHIGLKAVEISEKAEQIQKNLKRLEKPLNELETEWLSLYNHIKNAYNKASIVNEKYENLKLTIKKVTETTEDEK